MGKVVVLLTPLTKQAMTAELQEINKMQNSYRDKFQEMVDVMESRNNSLSMQTLSKYGTPEYLKHQSDGQRYERRIEAIKKEMEVLSEQTAGRWKDYRRNYGLA